jgi:hypothetical protein
VTAAQASVKTANAIANGARPASGPAAPPSSAGATLATTTPMSARPSRIAVIRVRPTGSVVSSAPQALWLIIATEYAV